jgi:hypothetical protein
MKLQPLRFVSVVFINAAGQACSSWSTQAGETPNGIFQKDPGIKET